MTALSSIKSDLRSLYRSRRRQLSPDVALQSSQQACIYLINHFQECHWKRLMLYLPIDGEISPEPLFHYFMNRNVEIIVPHTIKKDVNFYQLDTWNTPSFGEPIVSLPEIEAIIVPGIVFDRRGYRIGFGGGFYDRFLADYQGLAIGLAYECQVIDHINEDPWDVPVSLMATEKALYHFTRDKR